MKRNLQAFQQQQFVQRITSESRETNNGNTNGFVEIINDMETDKENRDTSNLPLNYSQQFDTPTKRRTEFFEEKSDEQISFEIATPRKTRQMKEITNTDIVKMQNEAMTPEKIQRGLVERIAQISFQLHTNKREIELERKEMQIERIGMQKEMQRERTELHSQIEQLHKKIVM